MVPEKFKDRPLVLIADDDPAMRLLAKAALEQAHFATADSEDGFQALVAFRELQPDIVLLDLMMPEMDGFTACRELRRQPGGDTVPILVITGRDDEDAIKRAYEAGATDFIHKPINWTILGHRVRYMVRAGRTFAELKGAEEALQRSLADIRRTLNETVDALATATELRDPYTAGHQKRVAQLSSAIAAKLGLAEERINGLKVMGFLHDIGKIVVPAEFLNRPGGLSEYEKNIVKAHAQAGYDILKNIDFPWPVAQAILQHHERLDGSGYPTHLQGEEIILEARILAVADVVEAMVSHRPYRPSLQMEQALAEITQNRGTLYDAEVVDACLELFTKDAFNFD
jgi:putative two-component system response regulator